MPWSVATPPAAEPILAADVKLHSRIDTDADDDKIDALIQAAREYLEDVTGRTFITTTYTLTLDRFPACDYIDLPRPPLASVTSVQYIDQNGDTQTFSSANYAVDTAGQPGRIYVDRDIGWPSNVDDRRNAVTVTYVAGYGNAAAVPEKIKQALFLLIGNWYENREATIPGVSISEVPMAARMLIDNLKVRGGLEIYASRATAP